MGNPFIHIELGSTDLDVAKAFYQAMFDWDLRDMPLPDSTEAGLTYTVIGVGGGTGGGMMKQLMPGAPSAWLPYVLVKDIRAETEKARSLGATICKDVSEVPGQGWLSIIRDPAGAMLGLWQYTNP